MSNSFILEKMQLDTELASQMSPRYTLDSGRICVNDAIGKVLTLDFL